MTDPIDSALSEGATGASPPNIALMQALMGAPSVAAFEAAIQAALQRRTGEGRGRLDAIMQLWRDHPQAWTLVHHVMASADHAAPKGSADEIVAHWAAAFDRVAASSPDAGSALYALGDPDLLARATREIVAKLEAWTLLGPDRDALEIGCGSGRFLAALAPRLRSILGLDISAVMVAEARRRCAGLANVRLGRTAGRDLAILGNEAVDLVLAVDMFPYLVGCGETLVDDHLRDIARVLRPAGTLLVLNYSYRADLDRDRAESARLAARHGLAIERAATGDFALWDGATFQFSKV